MAGTGKQDVPVRSSRRIATDVVATGRCRTKSGQGCPTSLVPLNLFHCFIYLTYHRKAKLTISKNARYKAQITVMPDYGRMWLWVNLVAAPDISRLEASDYEHAIIDSVSAALDADLADWQAEFEDCVNDAKTGAARLD